MLLYAVSSEVKVPDQPIEVAERMSQQFKIGTDLVRQCSNPRRWIKCLKYKNQSKLMDLYSEIYHSFDCITIRKESLEILKSAISREDDKDSLRSQDEVLNNSTGIETGKGIDMYKLDVLVKPVWTVGLDMPLKELKRMLMNSESIVHVLSAPGGYGKTTLARMLCQDYEIKAKFRGNIFAVTVSRTPNVKEIVRALILQNHRPIPEFESNREAIDHLKHFLTNLMPEPVLIFMDDVWPESESLLEAFEFQLPGYKLLLASRYTFPKFEYSTYRLKRLNDEDAMALFRHSVFQQNGKMMFFIDPDIVNEVVRGCGSNPLVLKVVGKSLYMKPETEWIKLINGWSKGHIFDTHMLDSIRISFDALDSGGPFLKDCFLDLASFPADAKFFASAIFDMWAELYKLDYFDCVHKLSQLSARNLIDTVSRGKDETTVNDCYNDHFVVVDDILRELAVHQNSMYPVHERKKLIIEVNRNRFPEWFLNLKHQPVVAQFISISTDKTFNSKWCNVDLPGVEVLLLNLKTETYILPKFMKSMKKLKVLIVINYGALYAEISDFSILGSLPTIRRLRFQHIYVPRICETAPPLKNLLKVSFVMCKLSQAFRTCTVQLSHILPRLEDIDIDYCDDLEELPSGICGIYSLKRLSITNCPKLVELPERIGDLSNLEVLRLNSCIELRGLPDSIQSLWELNFLSISDCVSLSALPNEIGELRNLRNIHMRGCKSLCELPESVISLVRLERVFCDEETAWLWQIYRSFFYNLQVHVVKEAINLNWLR